MTVAAVWIAAYLVSGLLYVRRDMQQPAWNRPGYTDTPSGRWRVRLLWLPVALYIFSRMLRRNRAELVWKFTRTELLPSLATFLTLGAAGMLLISTV